MHCCSPDGDTAGPALPALSAAALSAAPSRGARSRWPGRAAALIQWALPLTTLAAVPKCPGCVAGYVLLATGISLSFPAAAAMRWALLIICGTALAYLVVRAARCAITPARGRASPAPFRRQRSPLHHNERALRCNHRWFHAEQCQGDTTPAADCRAGRGKAV